MAIYKIIWFEAARSRHIAPFSPIPLTVATNDIANRGDRRGQKAEIAMLSLRFLPAARYEHAGQWMVFGLSSSVRI